MRGVSLLDVNVSLQIISHAGTSLISGRSPAPYKRDFDSKVRTFHKQLVANGYGQGPGKIRYGTDVVFLTNYL